MRVDFQVVKQFIKWIVYSLLLINFFLYLTRDWNTATHTMTLAEPLIKWMKVYATSIDYAAWLVLIILLELETYVLSDEVFNPLVSRLTHGLRLLCYLFVLHTVYAYSVEVYELYFEVEPIPEVSNLCQVADGRISFVSNQQYTYLDADNCAQSGIGKDYFLLDKGLVVADLANLVRERLLAWLDLAESICWLVIMVMIESTIRFQDRGVSSGPVITTGNYLKLGAYSVIMGIAVYWALTDLYLYFWDEMLWIGGFAAIEMNMSDWREDMEDANVTANA